MLKHEKPKTNNYQ